MHDKTLEFLKTIVGEPSPSGYEREVGETFRAFVLPFVDDVSNDVLGNVTAVINPEAAFKVMIAAHIDEIGLMIRHVSR